MKILIPLSLVVVIGFSGISCNDDPDPIEQDKFEIELSLNHKWDSKILELGQWYVTSNSDSFQLTKLNYHINHIELKGDNGIWHSADNLWYMVNSEETLSPRMILGDLDDMTFSAIRFTIGVADSLVNAEGQLNNLFTDAMYWGMANGYINFKLEGRSPKVADEAVVLHMGGYLPPNQAFKTIQIDFPSGNMVSSKLGSNKLQIDVNLAETFHSPNKVDLASTNRIHAPGVDAVRISENWETMFAFGGVN